MESQNSFPLLPLRDVVVFPHLNIGFSLVLNAETGLINELTTEFINRVLKYTRAEK